MTSWRTASVTLLSFSSGLPLGLVWIALPDWMRTAGIDIRIIGLITLAQAPWSFKLLWSPLMDRYALPVLGRRRGWMALSQVILIALGFALAGLGAHPDAPWVLLALALAIAFAAASQDIAYDAWTVDVLEPDEQGIAAGAKVAMYRGAMYVSGAVAISAAAWISWPLVNVLLALAYLPMILITVFAPEPAAPAAAPRTVAEAVWHPFLGFLGKHRALEILAFVFFYKFADNVAEALKRPFLVDMGYTDLERGIALGTIGVWATVGGAVLGGAITSAVGLGHALWIFGFLQIFSNVGYILMARAAPDLWLLTGAMGFESFTQGLGTGAFVALMLRLTQKRFSATQFALFSSLFALPRIVAGPISGLMVDAMGWEAFFWTTMVMGVPGLVLLQRFSPVGVRDPVIAVEDRDPRPPLSRGALVARGVLGGLAGCLIGAIALASVTAVKGARAGEGGFDLARGLAALVRPEGVVGWIQALGLLTFGGIVGLMTAAVFAARHGQANRFADS